MNECVHVHVHVRVKGGGGLLPDRVKYDFLCSILETFPLGNLIVDIMKGNTVEAGDTWSHFCKPSSMRPGTTSLAWHDFYIGKINLAISSFLIHALCVNLTKPGKPKIYNTRCTCT